MSDTYTTLELTNQLGDKMTTLTEQDLSEYTLKVSHFSVYEWRLDSSVSDTTGMCSIDDGCGCCDCGEDSIMRYEYSRPRYSKSRKAWELETNTHLVCVNHIDEV